MVLTLHSQALVKQVAELKQQWRTQYCHFEFEQPNGLLFVATKDFPLDTLIGKLGISPGKKAIKLRRTSAVNCQTTMTATRNAECRTTDLFD